MEEYQLNDGKLLLAEPFMLDPNFQRAVVLLCEHQHESSIGFIINKPLDLKINDLLEEFPEFDARIFFGGPVATDTVHFVHNSGELVDNSIRLKSGLYWGGDFSKLKILIETKLITNSNVRFYLGYTGWGTGQLAGELETGSWVLADMHPNYLFKTKPHLLWEQVMRNKGNSWSVIANIPNTPSLN